MRDGANSADVSESAASSLLTPPVTFVCEQVVGRMSELSSDNVWEEALVRFP